MARCRKLWFSDALTHHKTIYSEGHLHPPRATSDFLTFSDVVMRRRLRTLVGDDAATKCEEDRLIDIAAQPKSQTAPGHARLVNDRTRMVPIFSNDPAHTGGFTSLEGYMNRVAWLLIWIAVSLNLAAQASGDLRRMQPAFEIVSIRPITVDAGEFVLPDQLLVIGNRLQGRNISVAALIRSAYGPEIVSRDQVVDGPAWIGSERFNIDARAASVVAEMATGELPPAVVGMLRTALEERFQLRVRHETRALPRYALMYARADRSLKPGIRMSSLDCTAKREISGPCEFRPSPGNLVMRGRPIGSFVEFLARPAYAGGLVFDATGISGNVDIDLQWSMDFTDLPASTASLFTAIQEQLGLKLERRQIPLPVVVVEHIQRPSEN